MIGFQDNKQINFSLIFLILLFLIMTTICIDGLNKLELSCVSEAESVCSVTLQKFLSISLLVEQLVLIVHETLLLLRRHDW